MNGMRCDRFDPRNWAPGWLLCSLLAVVGSACIAGCASEPEVEEGDKVGKGVPACYRASLTLDDNHSVAIDFSVMEADGKNPRLVLEEREVVGARLANGVLAFGDTEGQLLLEAGDLGGLTGQWVVADEERTLAFELTDCRRVACPPPGRPASSTDRHLRPLDGEWIFYLPKKSMVARLSQRNGNVVAEFQGDLSDLTARGTISTESAVVPGACAALAKHRLRVSGFSLRRALVLEGVYDGEARIRGSLVTGSGAVSFHAKRSH